LLVGIRRDPQFGYALTLASGGVLVELVGDSRTLLLPCTQGDIETALASLKVARLLAGYRGADAADIGRIVALLHGFCTNMLAGRDRFEEVEINPLFIYPAAVVAVDVLLHRTGPG
jgi:succinyl-CoA synthetase beta subunit